MDPPGQARRVSRLPRWMHRLYAGLGGYFWLPCPLCGRFFGGHEWRLPHQTWFESIGSGRPVCPGCAGSAVVRQREREVGMIYVD